MNVHSFTESLDMSGRYANAPWWGEAYRAAFPDLMAHHAIEKDGWAQRGGIDRKIWLTSGKEISVDEKVREKDWPDFVLEYWSDWRGRPENSKKGWVACDLACDYIAYAFIPSGRCYLLPFQELRRAWRRHHREWVTRYRKPWHVAQNSESGRTWETHFVPVPIDVVLAALTDSLLVHFNAPALAEAA